jgi:hypothetical protein
MTGMLLAPLKRKTIRREVKFLVPRCPREKEFKIFSAKNSEDLAPS